MSKTNCENKEITIKEASAKTIQKAKELFPTISKIIEQMRFECYQDDIGLLLEDSMCFLALEELAKLEKVTNEKMKKYIVFGVYADSSKPNTINLRKISSIVVAKSISEAKTKFTEYNDNYFGSQGFKQIGEPIIPEDLSISELNNIDVNTITNRTEIEFSDKLS